MGNKEALLAGAKTCLLEKGFDRTTVRDIATAAGVSMAAIGYHYGSRENLLSQAIFAILDEWGDIAGRALVPAGDDTTAEEAYIRMWDANLEQIRAHPRMWLVSVDLFMQAQRQDDLRGILAAGMREGRSGLAGILTSTPEEDLTDETKRTVGMVQMALMSGVAIQLLSDPENAPTGADILTGLRALVKITE
ncbi:MAG TPA: TetR/AcrR family transcriptional regulator [Phytomonospora sp.]